MILQRLLAKANLKGNTPAAILKEAEEIGTSRAIFDAIGISLFAINEVCKIQNIPPEERPRFKDFPEMVRLRDLAIQLKQHGL